MGRKMDLVYPWYNLRQPKISLVYLEALVYTRDIPSICQNTKTYQRGQDSRWSRWPHYKMIHWQVFVCQCSRFHDLTRSHCLGRASESVPVCEWHHHASDMIGLRFKFVLRLRLAGSGWPAQAGRGGQPEALEAGPATVTRDSEPRLPLPRSLTRPVPARARSP